VCGCAATVEGGELSDAIDDLGGHKYHGRVASKAPYKDVANRLRERSPINASLANRTSATARPYRF